jgi:hypothetical protein
LKDNRRFRGACRLHHQGRINQTRDQGEFKWQEELLVSCLGYFLTLKIEATCSYETSVDFQRTTRRYIPEDGTLHNHRCENLKSYELFSSLASKTSHGFSPRRPEFEPGSGRVGFVVNKVALGQVSSKYFTFPCQFAFHRLLHNHHHLGLVQ